MTKERIIIVDVLRGFALLLIVLIHYVEHFELFKSPDVQFLFSSATDRKVMSITYLLISGKAYSIFAVLFGLSFFIQMNNKAQIGIDYRWRYMWRMMVLLMLGFLHSLIYRGDILHIYAMLSLPVIFLYNVRTKYLWIIVVLLFIQIPMIYNIIQSFKDPDYLYVSPLKQYFREGNIAYVSGNFWEVIQYNFWKGRVSIWSWTIDNGRYLQIISLFIVGLILGRKRVFENIDNKVKGLFIVLFASILIIVLINYLNKEIKVSDLSRLQKSFFNTLLTSFINLAATSGIMAFVTLLYIKFKSSYIFKLFSAYGKMSFSNYVFQVVFGVIFFYGFGLGMYRYFGTTWSLLFGALFFFLQALISKKWHEKYYYGPLEWFWRCCTNLDFSIKMKRS